jgi:hypothetical protein
MAENLFSLSNLWDELPDDPSPQQIEKLIEEASAALIQKNQLMHAKLIAKQEAMGMSSAILHYILTASRGAGPDPKHGGTDPGVAAHLPGIEGQHAASQRQLGRHQHRRARMIEVGVYLVC